MSSRLETLPPSVMGVILQKLNMLTGPDQSAIPDLARSVMNLATTSKTMCATIHSYDVSSMLVHSVAAKYGMLEEESAFELGTKGAKRFLWEYIQRNELPKQLDIIPEIYQIFVTTLRESYCGSSEDLADCLSGKRGPRYHPEVGSTKNGFYIAFYNDQLPVFLGTPFGAVNLCSDPYHILIGAEIRNIAPIAPSLKERLGCEFQEIDTETSGGEYPYQIYSIKLANGKPLPLTIRYEKECSDEDTRVAIKSMMDRAASGEDPTKILPPLQRPVRFDRDISKWVRGRLNTIKLLSKDLDKDKMYYLPLLDGQQYFIPMLNKVSETGMTVTSFFEHDNVYNDSGERLYQGIGLVPSSCDFEVLQGALDITLNKIQSSWKRVNPQEHPDILCKKNERYYNLLIKEDWISDHRLDSLVNHMLVLTVNNKFATCCVDYSSPTSGPPYLWIKKTRFHRVVQDLKLKLIEPLLVDSV